MFILFKNKALYSNRIFFSEHKRFYFMNRLLPVVVILLLKFSNLLSYTTQNIDELIVWKRNQISHLNVNSVNVILIKALEILIILYSISHN